MKKSTLLMIVSVVLAMTLSLGSTLAYLQDTDSDVNVMTLGNVQIEQHEQQRDGQGRLEEFKNFSTVYPAVIQDHSSKENLVVGDYTVQIRDKVNNYMDKIVTVENTGKSEAYVRTIFAFPEMGNFDTTYNASEQWLHWNGVSDTDTTTHNGWIWGRDKVTEWPGNNDNWDNVENVTIDDKKYDIYVVTNKNPLPAGKTTAPSLLGVFIDPRVSNEWDAAGNINYTFGDYDLGNIAQFEILVLSQAVQTAGFSDAWTALDEAFGDVTAENVQSWFGGTTPPFSPDEPDADEDGNIIITNAHELAYVAEQVNTGADTYAGKTVVLANDIDLLGQPWTPIGKASGQNYGFHGTFDGNGHTVSNFTVNNSEYAGLFGNVYTGEVKNLTVTDANITTNHYAGAIAGASYAKITNCHVKDSTIVCLPEETSTGWDNGDKAGAIIGYLAEGKTLGVTGCSVENVTITAYRDMGAVVGYTYSDVTNNTVKNVTLIKDSSHDYKGNDDNDTVNNYVGTVNKSENPNVKVESNTGDVEIINIDLTINTAEELFAFAKSVNEDKNGWSGKYIVLGADIDLENKEWTPIGQTGGYTAETHFQGTFDGQGHTISNLTVTNWESGNDGGKNYASGLFGFIDASAGGIKNLTIDGAVVKGHHWVGAVAGYLSGDMENCHVVNAAIENTHANDDACGDKGGAVVGQINGTKGKMTGCTASNSTVKGSRDAGQVVGAAYSSQVVDCSATNVTVTAVGDCTSANVNSNVIGRVLQ